MFGRLDGVCEWGRARERKGVGWVSRCFERKIVGKGTNPSVVVRNIQRCRDDEGSRGGRRGYVCRYVLRD
jgi:hypothetical protein